MIARLQLWLDGFRAWYRRRFRGFVAAPRSAGGQGTSWQQHSRNEIGFTCRCGRVMAFGREDYVVRSREHRSHDPSLDPSVCAVGLCHCPVTEARYVKLCPQCRLGHWKEAKP